MKGWAHYCMENPRAISRPVLPAFPGLLVCGSGSLVIVSASVILLFVGRCSSLSSPRLKSGNIAIDWKRTSLGNKGWKYKCSSCIAVRISHVRAKTPWQHSLYEDELTFFGHDISPNDIFRTRHPDAGRHLRVHTCGGRQGVREDV